MLCFIILFKLKTELIAPLQHLLTPIVRNFIFQIHSHYIMYYDSVYRILKSIEKYK